MRRSILLLSAVLLSSILLLGCQFCLYQHDVTVKPTLEKLDTALAAAYGNYNTGAHTSPVSTFVPLTGNPNLDVLRALFGTDGFVSAAESLGLSITDSTATCEVIKNEFIPHQVVESKRWLSFSNIEEEKANTPE